MKKRIISLLLIAAMTLSLLPLTVLPVSAVSASQPTISVEEVWAVSGGMVEVNIEILNNPGILGATLTLSWAEELTLIDAEEGNAFTGLTYQEPSYFANTGTNFVWYGTNLRTVQDGTVLKMTFQVAEAAVDGSTLEISIAGSGITDTDKNSVIANYINGGILVLNYTPGDVDDSGEIDPYDLITLAKYISDGCKTDPNGYNVAPNVSASDVNDDGEYTPLDLILISQYISDDCVTDPDGYNVTLKPSTPKCKHTMEAIAYKAAKCEESGNLSYYHCTTCDRYFNNSNGSTEITLASTVLPQTGHTAVTDPYVEPTPENVGWTEGSHCSVCKKVLVAQQEISKLQRDEYHITYHISESDLYLQSLESQNRIENENPSTYFEGDSITLLNLSVLGYTFEGWYDGAGQNAEQIKKISNQTGAVHLYAHWTKNEYTVQFDAPIVPVAAETYTVDAGLTLKDPDLLPGYLFMGWSDANGKLVEQIPVGSVGNITLYGNWTSARNQTRPNTNLGTPVIHFDEENNQILFAYEIGTVENIPLYELEYIGNVAVPGTNIERSITKGITIDETSAQEISEAISNATTKSSEWTLSSEWTESSSISESHLHEMDSSISSNTSAAYSNSGTFNISTSNGGSTTTSVEAGVSAKIGSKVSSEASVGFPLDIVDVGAKVSTEISSEVGAEVKTSETDTKTWNTNKGYEASQSASYESSVSQSMAEKISNSVTYDVSKAATEGKSNTESTAETSTNSREYASAFTYSTAQFEEQTYTATMNNAPVGYYRMVAAGKAHVFAVVVYDIASRSYGTYSYSIMEDTVRPFLDYSKESDSFNDNENGVLSFEVPYFVNEYVDSIIGASDGLIINEDTGIIEAYTGNDEIVVIPQYLNVADGNNINVVKVKGIKEGLFMGKTGIKAVQMCSNITEIPKDAFNGCTSLVMAHAPSASAIGESAFAGCTSLKDYTVSDKVGSLGTGAFQGVGKVTVNASSVAVADNAISSGAKNIVLNMDKVSEALENKTYTVPEGTSNFTFNGGSKTYNNLLIASDADTTILNNATFVSNNQTALNISSEEVVLNKVSISAPGIAMKLTADRTRVGLQGKVSISTTGAHAAVTQNVEFYQYNASAVGSANFTGNLLVSGDEVDAKLLAFTKGKIIYIDSANPAVLTFDPNGGAVKETTRLVYGDTEIGELPLPTRDFYTFKGWFDSAEGGTQITAGSLIAEDTVLYARWELNATSGWVLASELPAGAEIVNTKWSYILTTNTESKETSLAGYTQTGSYWVKSGSGSKNYATFPSGFDTSHNIYTSFAKSVPYTATETATTKREVTNAKAGYVYWHWMYNTDSASGTATRAIYNKKGTGPDNGFSYKYFGAFTSTKGDYKSDTSYCNSLGIRNYIVPERTAYADCQGATRWFRFDYYKSSYVDYYKMFQYQKIENLESATEITASDTISNVQKWVQYRTK